MYETADTTFSTKNVCNKFLNFLLIFNHSLDTDSIVFNFIIVLQAFISLRAMNNTENDTTFLEPEEEHHEEEVGDVTKIIVIGAYAIIFLLSIAGNSLILHIVRTRPSIRQNPFNWLLVNTALADFLNVTAASSFTVPLFLCGDCWLSGTIGTVLCKLIPFSLTVSICVSIWSLVIIAADRYLAIVCSVCQNKRPMSSRSVLRCIAAVWFFAGLIFSWELYIYKVDEVDDDVTECYTQWHAESEELSTILLKAEMVFKAAITFAIPLVIMGVLYSLIAKFLWNHKPPGSGTQPTHAKRTKSFRGVIKMLMTAVAVFALCWFPVHFCHIMWVFFPNTYQTIPAIIQVLFYWVAHANAAIHPWLFIAFSENLRREAKGILQIFQSSCNGKKNVFDQIRLRTVSLPTLITTPDMSSRRATTMKRGSYVITGPL